MYASVLKVGLTIVHADCTVCGKHVCVIVPGSLPRLIAKRLIASTPLCEEHNNGVTLAIWFDEQVMADAFEVDPMTFRAGNTAEPQIQMRRDWVDNLDFGESE